MAFVNLNGKLISSQEPALLPSNRGYRYGDGIFETIKMVKGNLIWWDAHYNRLQKGFSTLHYKLPALVNSASLKSDAESLCKKNNCTQLARIRLSVFRGNGGLYDEDRTAQYLIECWPLNESAQELNENGLVTGIYTAARKSCDAFANLKSANFLPYSMAAQYAMEQKLNDCLVLNTAGNIADSTIANLFLIKNSAILTPALSEGCVEGITRNFLLQQLRQAGYSVSEGVITPDTLQQADEVFLTNCINGMRWVGSCEAQSYTRALTAEIYNRFFQTIVH